VLDGFDVTLVDIHCSEAELVRREAERGDRPIGLGASQSTFVHEDRDLAVDTTARSAHECAVSIAEQLDTLSSPKAFDRMRSAGA
jgi:chloramphenicol 3-O phosphotransferase